MSLDSSRSTRRGGTEAARGWGPRALVATLAFLASACGPEFDRPAEIQTLRVMAVQKSAAYAAPGETVEMSMLWHDGSPKAPRNVQVAWLSGCFNPPGDQFSSCAAAFAQAAEGGGGGGQFGLPPGISVAFGDQFSFQMPADVIDKRPPGDPDLPRYGLGYVFFAACAGNLGPAPAGQLTFPLACYDASGAALGSDDFVAGYSAVYAYDTFRNENPIITGFRLNGQNVTPSCIGPTCLVTPPTEPDCAAGDPCLDACDDDGGDDCPGVEVRPEIDRESAEPDAIAKAAYGRDLTEQVWVRYYSTAGVLKSDARLVNDAQTGWDDQFETEFRSPAKTGPVSIWAVVHDNRGGVEWARIEVWIR